MEKTIAKSRLPHGRETLRLVELTVCDLGRIIDLERRAFEPEIQADRDLYLKRFDLGHIMLGVETEDRLAGIISFSYTRFDLDALDRCFPQSFKEFSTQPTAPHFNSVCFYNLGVEPSHRGLRCTKALVHSAFQRAVDDGCLHAFADGPIPSYAGNSQVGRNPHVRQAIDEYVRTGRLPSRDEFLQDPVMKLYSHLVPCEFRWLIPNFLPEDTATGGWRVILYRDLHDWKRSAETERQVAERPYASQ